MPASEKISFHPLLDELQESLYHVLTVLHQKWDDVSLSLEQIRSPKTNGAERSFRMRGPEEMDVRIRFAVYPLGDGTYEVYVEVEDGPTCRFTCDPMGEEAERSREKAQLGREVTAVLLREIEPRLGRAPVQDAPSSDSPTVVPSMMVDRDGAINQINDAAREVLDYSAEASIARNFFSYVHGQNLRRVMRDLARMVSQDLQSARWLLRLHTGSDRWRWYRVKVLNHLEARGAIRMLLHPLEGDDGRP